MIDLDELEEAVNRLLILLVHVQQSSKVPAGKKLELFGFAVKTADAIYNHTEKFQANNNDYNAEDTRAELFNALKKIITDIEYEYNYYVPKYVTISRPDFSYYDIRIKLTSRNYDVSLNLNNLNHLFYFKELQKDKTPQVSRDEEKKDIDDKEMEEIKKKAFLSLLKSKNNLNPERFYQVNKFIIEKLNSEHITYVHDPRPGLSDGLVLIELVGEKIIRRCFAQYAGNIEYSIKIIDTGSDYFRIHIQGYIQVNNQKQEFKILEMYPDKMFTNVINGYNLRKLFNRFDGLAREEKDRDNPGDPGSGDIDDFLDGRIE
jgi:hypothetical protein